MTKYQKYKLSIISVFCLFIIYITYGLSLNGRYEFKENASIILDTRSGTIYIPKGRKFFKIESYKDIDAIKQNK